MATEVILQVALLLLTLAMLCAIQYLPKQTLTKLRRKNRADLRTKSHLLQGSHLLTRAGATTNRLHSQSLAKTALAEAETAISFSPKDPAPHILRALALDLLGHKSSALRSLDYALSPPRVKLLSEKERGDALVKRAQLKLEVNRRRRVDSAVEDLEEAVGLSQGGRRGGRNSKVLCLLGECYEFKEMREKARWAFREALLLEPDSVLARQGLARTQ